MQFSFGAWKDMVNVAQCPPAAQSWVSTVQKQDQLQMHFYKCFLKNIVEHYFTFHNTEHCAPRINPSQFDRKPATDWRPSGSSYREFTSHSRLQVHTKQPSVPLPSPTRQIWNLTLSEHWTCTLNITLVLGKGAKCVSNKPLKSLTICYAGS